MPTNNPRPEPVIPDHEVLRKVGGGAYGEVWLARGVTGALRAVKVVYREDFDDERSFEREFEGILKFEPISRDHPGLVNILHVGRSPDFAFYYYVMELGDDVTAGRDINPIEYEARTLRSDIKRTPGRRLATEHVIDCGQRLAEALRHLHDNDLAHRDVKPANVIFVNGKAKLADIGLVASRGQRTFVGTEGFVPPEGPGSAQADVYSLGKVLYEIATGKDRLDFPELPDELPGGPERKSWLALNQIICDVCEPQLSKRSISSAGDLSDALRRLQQGKRRRRRRPTGAFFFTLFIGGIAGLVGWEALRRSSWIPQENLGGLSVPKTFPPATNPPSPVVPSQVKVQMKFSSSPSGADIVTLDGQVLGSTPFDYSTTVTTGQKVAFYLRKEGYKDAYLQSAKIEESTRVLLLQETLKNFTPPVENLPWIDQLGQQYRPAAAPGESGPKLRGHETVGPVENAAWLTYSYYAKRPENSGEFIDVDGVTGRTSIVLTTEAEARLFCEWMTSECIEKGFLTDKDEIIPVMIQDFNNPAMSERAQAEGLRPFRCLARAIPFASIEIATEPKGAEVYLSGPGAAGATSDGSLTEKGSLKFDDLKPGDVTIVVVLEGYKLLTETLTLKAGESRVVNYTLTPDVNVTMDKKLKNSLGMVFVPVGKDLMASVWETRVKDYEAFVRADGGTMPRAPDFTQESTDHPMVYVSRDDCVKFCEWLTRTEQAKDLLTKNHVYRLPTDYEWSKLVDLEETPTGFPDQRDPFSQNPIFLWGKIWPPPPGAGNLADMTAADGAVPSSRTIPNYNDHYKFTAPVGQFEPFHNIYDLCGNVAEWVSDPYSADSNSGVLRGGGWNTYQEQNLYKGARMVQPPSFRDSASGFRVMLAKVAPLPEKPPEETPPVVPPASSPAPAPTPAPIFPPPPFFPLPDHG